MNLRKLKSLLDRLTIKNIFNKEKHVKHVDYILQIKELCYTKLQIWMVSFFLYINRVVFTEF